MELEGSLPHSQQHATCYCPEPDQCTPSPIPLIEDHFNIILSPTPGSSKWSPSFKSPQKSSVCTPSLSHSHLSLHPYFILLDTVALEYLFKCTDCEDPLNGFFPRILLTPSLLCPIALLSNLFLDPPICVLPLI